MVPSLLPIAFYGTLMEGLPAKPGRPRFEQWGRYLDACEIKGLLQDWGPYPHLVEGNGIVHGQLWQPQSPKVLSALDDWEFNDPSVTEEAKCSRTKVMLLTPKRQAWVYLYAFSPKLPLIDLADWSALPKAHDLTELLRLAAAKSAL
jgi:gamma-glutamylcyclotransferase (GGCT)/AIG2-like uncharacterized protein YtfP